MTCIFLEAQPMWSSLGPGVGRLWVREMLVSAKDSIQTSTLRFAQAQTDLLILGPWPLSPAAGRELSLYIDWLMASSSQLMRSNAVLSC